MKTDLCESESGVIYTNLYFSFKLWPGHLCVTLAILFNLSEPHSLPIKGKWGEFASWNCWKSSSHKTLYIGMDKEDVHIDNGILLSHIKERNWVICRDADGPRNCHTEWNKSEREK